MKQIRGFKRELIECHCNNCGSSNDVNYDTTQDYYICYNCLQDEEDQIEEELINSDKINDWNETLQEFQKEKF
jgi:hypothetical protein